MSAFIEEAVRAEGSTQALASRLNAPHTTLIRWMTGHAQTPLRVFVAVLHFLMELEEKSAARLSLPNTSESGAGGVLVFPLGPLQARCVRCDGVQFRLLDGPDLRLTSRLACAACDEVVLHGNLLAQLAKDAVQHSRARGARGNRAVEESRQRIQQAARRLDSLRGKLRDDDSG